MVITAPLVIALLLTVLQVAVLAWDITRYRIPNKLSLLLAIGFVPFALLAQPEGWCWHLLIAAGALLIGYLLFSLKVIGGGDAKWLAACCLWTGAAATGAATTGAAGDITTGWASTPMLLTMRTLPSASVISSSDTFESDTRSINVLSLRKSIDPPKLCADAMGRIYTKFQ